MSQKPSNQWWDINPERKKPIFLLFTLWSHRGSRTVTNYSHEQETNSFQNISKEQLLKKAFLLYLHKNQFWYLSQLFVVWVQNFRGTALGQVSYTLGKHLLLAGDNTSRWHPPGTERVFEIITPIQSIHILPAFANSCKGIKMALFRNSLLKSKKTHFHYSFSQK